MECQGILLVRPVGHDYISKLPTFLSSSSKSVCTVRTVCKVSSRSIIAPVKTIVCRNSVHIYECKTWMFFLHKIVVIMRPGVAERQESQKLSKIQKMLVNETSRQAEKAT